MKARCDIHAKSMAGNKYSSKPYLPEGDPNIGIVCGAKDCQNEPKVYLKHEQETEYDNGLRVFGGFGGSVKLRLQ